MDQTIDKSVVNLMKAIKQHESGNDYTKKGASGEYGAYQYLPSTFQDYSQRYANIPGAKIDDPVAQDKVTYATIKAWKDKGYTPEQVLSMWNAGEGAPNAYQEGKKGTNAQGVSYDVPNYVSTVSSIALGGGAPGKYPAPHKPSFMTEEPKSVEQTREEMTAAGEPVSVNPNRVEPTFAGKLIRGLVKPTATLLARPIQLIKALGGATTEEQTIKSKYLGDIKTSESGKDVVKDIGRGLETVSLGIGGGAVGDVAKGVGKQTLGQIAKQGAKEGLKAGVLGGAGASIEEGDPIGKVAENAALGGAIGAVSGGALAGAGTLLGKGARGTSNVLRATGVMKADEEAAQKAIQTVAQEYERAAGTGLKPGFRKRQQTMTGDFKPWNQTLAEYGIVPQEGIDHTWDVERALSDIDEINTQFRATKEKIAANESALFDVDEALNNAYSRIDDNIPSELARKEAKTKLLNEVEAIIGNKNVPTNQSGGRLLTAPEMERIRDVGYSLTPFNASDPQRIYNSAGKALASGVNQVIDKYSTFPSYRAFNREWSNILNAQDALEQLSTKKVRLSKGLSGQIALKTLAPILGFSQGGILGAILGDLGGETVGRLLSDPELRTIISRSIIKKANQKLTKDAIIQQVEKEIQDYLTTQASRPLLGPATSIPLGPEQPGQSSVRMVPAKKNPTTVNPKSGKFQRTYSSTPGLLP